MLFGFRWTIPELLSELGTLPVLPPSSPGEIPGKAIRSHSGAARGAPAKNTVSPENYNTRQQDRQRSQANACCKLLFCFRFYTITSKSSLKNCIFFQVSEPFWGDVPHRGYSRKCCSSGSCTTYSVYIGQHVPVLEPRFRLPEHVIDLLLHPGLDLGVVRQDRDQKL